MKILHLAAGNRWTGAAAPAFAEVEALRGAGVDAHYAYVGGYKLQAKIGHHDFAHPLIEKRQNPWSFRRSVEALDRLVRQHGFDVVHAHLTYDHWLARMIARHRDVRLARTFHARRVLRRDPFTRSLLRRTELLFGVNSAFENTIFTPPPVDHRQFTPDGSNVRALYGLTGEPLFTVIGKLSKGRGFEDALQTFAALRGIVAGARLMIVGHGEHRPALEQHAASFGVNPIWAGYHEDDLAEHYRASNVLLFTARGSDEGHRALLEAMACGVTPATYPLDGVHKLVPAECIAPASTPESLARTAAALIGRDLDVYERSLDFSYERAAKRLIDAYSSLLSALSSSLSSQWP